MGEAIEKELKQLNDYDTFRVLEPGEKMPSDYQKIPYHILFDVKFDLRRNACLVAGGNWTNPRKEDLYSGVVGMESVRLGFFLGEQNGLSCCAADLWEMPSYMAKQRRRFMSLQDLNLARS